MRFSWGRLFLTLKWVFGYRAVFMREPSIRQLVVYAKMGRAVAGKKCAVCHGEYWVIGNPKIKGHFSPVCARRQCYMTYYGDWSGNPANRIKTPPVEGTRSRGEIRQAARKVVAKRKISAKFSGNESLLAGCGAPMARKGERHEK